MLRRGGAVGLRRWTLGEAALATVVGTAIHDVVEFGYPSPQNTAPVAVALAATTYAWHRFEPRRAFIRVIGIGFAALVLVGGAVASVIPLPIWPFRPEQSLRHYTTHALWALSLLPLLLILAAGNPGRRRSLPYKST